jgi:hypothetical protein
MNKEPTTYGLSRKKVVRILQIGSEKEDIEDEFVVQENTAELLRDQLAQPFPFDRNFSFCTSELSNIPCHPAALMRIETVGDLLCNHKTTISVLKKLKEFGKSLFSEGKNSSHRDVGLTIYYGTIANSLVSHDVRITRLPYKELLGSFITLADKEWMPSQLQVLFRRAIDYCKAKDQRGR